MKANFDNKDVKAFFNKTAQLGGDTKKVDTQKERDKIAEYLAGNADNLSDNDFAILDSFVQSGQKKNVNPAPTNNIELDLDVEEGSISQINIGDDNKNTVIIKNEPAKPSMGLATPNKDVVKPTEDKRPVDKKADKKLVDAPVEKKTDKKLVDAPVEKKADKKLVDAPVEKKTDKPVNGIDDPVDIIPEDRLYFDDYGKIRDRKTGELVDFKYNIWVDMMPGSGAKRDLNYIKDSVISQIKDFPIPYIDDACYVVKSCRTQDEVTFCLACYGIGIEYPV